MKTFGSSHFKITISEEGSDENESEENEEAEEKSEEKVPVIDNSRLGKWLSTDDKPAAEADEPEPVEEFVELTKEEMEERKQKAEEIIKRNQMTQEELDEVEDRIGELEVKDPADVPVWGKKRVRGSLITLRVEVTVTQQILSRVLILVRSDNVER